MFLDIIEKNFRDTYEARDLNKKIELPFEIGESCAFDLLDKQDKIIHNAGDGSVTIHNDNSTLIVAFDFERFMNQFKYDGKRCDFILFPMEGESFIIFNELSKGRFISKRKDAEKQLYNSVSILMENSDIKAYIEKFANKYCVISCIDIIPSTPLGMADPFMKPYELTNEALHWNNTGVDVYGFETYAATDIYIKKDDIDFKILRRR